MKLTQVERRSIFAGRTPKLIRPVKPEPCELALSGKVTLVIKGSKKLPSGAGHQPRYVIEDRRDEIRLLARKPPALNTAMMERDARTPPTRAELHKAGLESSYTSNPLVAITDAGEALTEAEQIEQTKHSQRIWGDYRQVVRVDEIKREQNRRYIAQLDKLQREAVNIGADIEAELEAAIENCRVRVQEQRRAAA